MGEHEEMVLAAFIQNAHVLVTSYNWTWSTLIVEIAKKEDS